MRINDNGIYRDMTKSELAEWSKKQAEYDAMPKPALSEAEMIHNLQLENAELIKRIEKIEKDVSDLQLESGGSVLPNPGTDPNPEFKPKPGGGLTIGG